MKNSSPLVSIITPSYDAEHFITEMIESVLAQTYSNWELIIVDDCSLDQANKIIESFMRCDERIRLIRLEKNSGPAIARNTAISEANGKYIAFLDADDMWKSTKLERQISFMQKNGYAFTYSSYDVIDEEGNMQSSFIPPSIISYDSMLKTCSVGCLTAIYDAELLGKMYMPKIIKRQDYGLWLNILKECSQGYATPENLAIYRLRKGSVSSNKVKASQYQWKIYREVERLSLLKSAYYFCNYAINGLLKYR